MKTLSDIIEQAIDITLKNIKVFEEHNLDLSNREYYREIGTLTLGFPRRIGKTSAIDQLASYKDIVITPNIRMSEVYKYASNVIEESMITSEYLQDNMYKDTIIFLDEPFYMFNIRKDLDLFLDELYEYKPKLVVLIGTPK